MADMRKATSSGPSMRLLPLLLLGILVAAPAEARTRTFCGVVQRACGGQLQPVCTSGAACDSGYSVYHGSPFPITIDCPWPIADVKVTAGCYQQVPDCTACSAEGQIPCPAEAEPWCTAGCDAGLEEDPLTTLCADPGSIGLPTAGLNETCAPGLISCEDGLQCTLALLCSHDPAQEGETCDATAPCAAGLYCQAGVPQVCRRYRTAGEGCSAFNPCADGLSCEACFTDKCKAPLQCFPNANAGAITEQQCRKLYSPVIADGITGGDVTLTWAGGNGVSVVASESQAFGVAYGQNGEYGCFTTLCFGVNSDVEITGAFSSVGFSTDFAGVGGKSFDVVETAQTPFSLLSFSTSQSWDRLSDDAVFPPVLGDLSGTEDAFALGGGLNPWPITAGTMYCDTVLDPVVIDPGQNEPPPLELPPLEQIVNPDFETDLFGWRCANGGVCGWAFDSPEAPASVGSGRVASPPPGSLTTLGRLESSCVRVQEEFEYRAALWLRTTGPRTGAAELVWSAGPQCDGDVLRIDGIGSSPPDGVWRRIASDFAPPAGAHTVRLGVTAESDLSTEVQSTTLADRVFIPEPAGAASGAAAAAALARLARRRRGRG